MCQCMSVDHGLFRNLTWSSKTGSWIKCPRLFIGALLKKKKKKHPSTFLSNLKIKQLLFYKDYQQKWDLINEMCYVHNIFITNHSYLVVIDSNLNLTLRLLFCFNNNN